MREKVTYLIIGRVNPFDWSHFIKQVTIVLVKEQTWHMVWMVLLNEVRLISKSCLKLVKFDLKSIKLFQDSMPRLIIKSVASISLVNLKSIEQILSFEVMVSHHVLDVTCLNQLLPKHDCLFVCRSKLNKLTKIVNFRIISHLQRERKVHPL